MSSRPTRHLARSTTRRSRQDPLVRPFFLFLSRRGRTLRAVLAQISSRISPRLARVARTRVTEKTSCLRGSPLSPRLLPDVRSAASVVKQRQLDSATSTFRKGELVPLAQISVRAFRDLRDLSAARRTEEDESYIGYKQRKLYGEVFARKKLLERFRRFHPGLVMLSFGLTPRRK